MWRCTSAGVTHPPQGQLDALNATAHILCIILIQLENDHRGIWGLLNKSNRGVN